MFNPDQQTSSTDATSPQGNLSAYALMNTRVHGFNKSFTEHGIVIGLCNVRTDLSYQQGINKTWLRQTREEFYWPTFAHLGEQAVLNKEIMRRVPRAMTRFSAIKNGMLNAAIIRLSLLVRCVQHMISLLMYGILRKNSMSFPLSMVSLSRSGQLSSY
jgi:hypothetical protein